MSPKDANEIPEVEMFSQDHVQAEEKKSEISSETDTDEFDREDPIPSEPLTKEEKVEFIVNKMIDNLLTINN